MVCATSIQLLPNSLLVRTLISCEALRGMACRVNLEMMSAHFKEYGSSYWEDSFGNFDHLYNSQEVFRTLQQVRSV